jgi:hypothetical protein
VERKQAEAESEQQYKDEQIALSQRLVNVTKVYVVATILILIVGVIVGGGQLLYVHRQWKLASDGLSKMGDQIWAAKNAAFAAQKAADTAADGLRSSNEYLGKTLKQMQAQTAVQGEAADAAKSGAETAKGSLVLAERPWVKIKHRIIEPLTFNQAGPVAKIVIEDTLENVGPTVALNVLSWEEVIPIDAGAFPFHRARLRQSEYCDANRHPDPRQLQGYMLFPHDPQVQNSIVGPTMETVMKAAAASPGSLSGKVGFMLVGCVFYRSSFEPASNPTHQTRFVYLLGKVVPPGFLNQYVIPSGVASELQLIAMPDGFSAD